MNILERNAASFLTKQKIWKLAYVRFVRFCFLTRIIELKTQQDKACLEQRE